MEDELDIPQPLVRRSKRPRVHTKPSDGQLRDIVDSEGESGGDEFDGIHRTAKTAPSTMAALLGIDQSLIEVVKGNGRLIPQVIKSWVEKYEKEPKPAMVELLSMLFEACGAKHRIQGEFLDETNVDDVVVALVSLAAQSRIEDHQSYKKKEFRSFQETRYFLAFSLSKLMLLW